MSRQEESVRSEDVQFLSRLASRHTELNCKKLYEVNRCGKRFSLWLSARGAGPLASASTEDARLFLIAMERHCSTAVAKSIRYSLLLILQEAGISEAQTKLPARCAAIAHQRPELYCDEAVRLVTRFQAPVTALMSRVMSEAGLLAYEVYSLQPAAEYSQWLQRQNLTGIVADMLWYGRRQDVLYTVSNRTNGLRPVRLPVDLARAWERLRQNAPMRISYRGKNYTSWYRFPSLNVWSADLAAASLRALGKNIGAKGLRMTYARERYAVLSRVFLPGDVTQILCLEQGASLRTLTGYLSG